MGCDESTPVRTILRRRSVLDGWLVQDAVGATLQLPTSGARVRLVFVEAQHMARSVCSAKDAPANAALPSLNSAARFFHT